MRLSLLIALVSVVLAQQPAGVGGVVIDSMDQMTFTPPPDHGRLTLVPGRTGSAIQFTFDEGCQGKFAVGRAAGTPEWDRAAGFSFWVKGDGSDHLGGIEFIHGGDYGTRYAYAFPIHGREWTKVVVRWSDLVPELAKTALGVDPKLGNPPSRLGPLQLGKWWYWRDYGAHSYAIDDVRLETSIAPERPASLPAGRPLARVRSLLAKGKPVTIVTMGDSLTDTAHWTNREHNWPKELQSLVKSRYGSEMTVVNPAMGGTELRHNVILIPRWSRATPAPDLVTVFFGFNDWSSGMRGAAFQAAQIQAIDRIRRATAGQSDVLILTTCPTLENGGTLAEMAAACRAAAGARKAGLGDVFAAFTASPEASRFSLYATDKVHLGLGGQKLVAETVLKAIETDGR